MKRIIAALLFTATVWAQTPTAPTQPIPFNHKQHTAASLKCNDCHTMPDPGEVVTFPTTTKCLACHRTIKADAPAIKDLQRFATAKQDVPWVRVYQIPSFVYFSHKVHTDAGTACETCHGPVAQREQLAKETDLSMGACMSCHSTHKATLDCAGCHEAKS